MTVKIALVTTVAMLALASTGASIASSDHPIWNEAVDKTLALLELNEQEIRQVRSAVHSFRDERRRAEESMRSTVEALPPEEEVLAVRTYVEAGLEERLAGLLSNEQLDVLMAAIREQREQQMRMQALR
jgi:hypothetical protein